MSEFLKKEWKYLLGVTAMVVLLFFIYNEYQQWKQYITRKPDVPPMISINTNGEASKSGEPQLVYVQGQNTNTKEIAYVPKEINSETGQLEKTDVQVDRKQGKVYVKVNGKDFEIPEDIRENSVFENGKLVITEDTQMRLNITAPKPSFNVGLGWSKEGPSAQLNGPLYKNMSWWIYGDKKTASGGVQFPIMK